MLGIDNVSVVEDVAFGDFISTDLNITAYDEIAIMESPIWAPTLLTINAIDTIALMTDIVKYGFDPLSIINNENIVWIAEFADYTIDTVGLYIENIKVTEVFTIKKQIDFNTILRSYPYVSRRLTGYQDIQFDNGLVQERDLWGRTKMQFEINFPPMTRQQALDVDDVYKFYKGTTFQFTNPVDGKIYTVRIVDKLYEFERRYFNTFYARMVIEEV